MARLTNAFQVFQAVGDREDLADWISNISPTDTPMLSRFRKGQRAEAVKVEWQTDTLATATSNAQIEGFAAVATAVSATTRVANYCQISEKTFTISRTQEQVSKAGRKSEIAFQTTKKLKELARDMEWTLVNGTSATGASGTARTLSGILEWISTNTYSASGSALTETYLNDMLEDCWDQGGSPNAVYCGGPNKRIISGFTTNPRNIEADVKKLVSAVDVYLSDFGPVRMVLDRYLTTTLATVLTVQEDLWEIRYLQPPKVNKLAKTGDGETRLIVTEYTLVSRNETGSGKINGLST